jgi:hypothetical protein
MRPAKARGRLKTMCRKIKISNLTISSSTCLRYYIGNLDSTVGFRRARTRLSIINI